MIASIFIIFCYVKTIRNIRNELKTPAADKITKRLFMYPFIIVIAFLVAIANSIYENNFGYNFVITLIHVIITHGQALWNCLYFAIDKKAELSKCFAIVFCRQPTSLPKGFSVSLVDNKEEEDKKKNSSSSINNYSFEANSY